VEFQLQPFLNSALCAGGSLASCPATLSGLCSELQVKRVGESGWELSIRGNRTTVLRSSRR
jgi:hypothetical protein